MTTIDPAPGWAAEVTPPAIAWVPPGTPASPALVAIPCPNCGSEAPKTHVLAIDVQLPDNAPRHLNVLHCPDCTCRFYDVQTPLDYGMEALNQRGRVPFYVQQGAGVSLIISPLAQLPQPRGTAYMEVGCGYGFGLDYALNTRGWQGLGIDPAPLAALGRDALGLPIELRLLREDDEAQGTMDVVAGSEVIEHVPSPAAFVRTLKAMLRPAGVMVLTTPNGEDIRPGTPDGVIIPLLSPTLHLVIQTPRSLEALLRRGGFAHVAVSVDSHSLVAFASDAPIVLEHDTARLRPALRAHLEGRANRSDPAGDPFLGFAGRAFMESVNDGDMAMADRAWALLGPACRARFGFDLDGLSALPERIKRCGLEEMARLVPLNLAGLLYGRAIRRLAAGAPRTALEPQFLLAAKAAAAMRRALGQLAMEDGQTEDIGWTAAAEAALCAAEAGGATARQRLAALPPAPTGGAARRLGIIQRGLTLLVNAGHYETASALAAEAGLTDAPLPPEDPVARDALYSLGVLDLAAGDAASLGRARLRFAAVRGAAPAGSGLALAALRGEVQARTGTGDAAGAGDLAAAAALAQPGLALAEWAVPILVGQGRLDEARQIAERGALASAPFARPGATRPPSIGERSVLFALAMLDLRAGAAAMARERFRRVRTAAAAGSDLWTAALNGELEACEALGDAPGIAITAAALERPSVQQAARMLGSLVNAGQLDAARGLVARSRFCDQPFTQPGRAQRLSEAERDQVFFLAMLDLQPDPAMARTRFAAVQAASVPGGPLWWSALRGEVQALDRMEAPDDAAACLVAAAAPFTAGVPDDLKARMSQGAGGRNSR